jgi:hypothetical protein
MVWDSLEYAPIITSVRIADGAVTASSLAADAIDGKVITGATIRTAAGGQRWELGTGASANTLFGYSGRTDEVSPYGLQSTVDGIQLVGAGVSGVAAGSTPAYIQVGNRAMTGYPKLPNGVIYEKASSISVGASGGLTSTGTNEGGLWALTASPAPNAAPTASSSLYVMGTGDGSPARIDMLSAGNVNIGGNVSGAGTVVVGGSTIVANAQIEAKAGILVTGAITRVGQAWVAPTFQGGWSNYGTGGYENVGYMLMPDGSVKLRGLAKGGGSGFANPVFTLPVGFRPAGHQLMLGSASGGVADIRVFASGEVCVYGYFAGGTNASVSLGMCSFVPA